MIYYTSPYNTQKNIGVYYNYFVKSMYKDDDWVCFVDGDTIFLTEDYGDIIEQITNQNKEFKIFTCLTNRIGNPKQLVHNLDMNISEENKQKNNMVFDSDDIAEHRKIAKKIQEKYKSKVVDLDSILSNIYTDSLLSGVMILSQKKTLKKLLFNESGMLGVDNEFHKKAKSQGLKIGLMQGVYIYHWYRGGVKTTNHLT